MWANLFFREKEKSIKKYKFVKHNLKYQHLAPIFPQHNLLELSTGPHKFKWLFYTETPVLDGERFFYVETIIRVV